jgi:uncharacterized repeat protein (TIGR02543 family)
VSTDGFQKGGPDPAGVQTSSGTVSILKPTGATNVVAAFLSSGGVQGVFPNRAPATTLDADPVSFSYKSVTSKFENHLADVTTIVRDFMDSPPSGAQETRPLSGSKFEIPITYESTTIGSAGNTYPQYSSGLALTVVFENPTLASDTSVMVYFGQAASDSQQTQFAFDPLAANASGSSLSLAIAWSAAQSNEVSIVYASNEATPGTVSSDSGNFTLITQTAGRYDDTDEPSRGYLTVGGVGDSVANPGAEDTRDTDDELYNVDSLLTAGTEKITLETNNPSGDDNFFQAVLFLPFGVEAPAGSYAVTYDSQGGSAVADGFFTVGGSVTFPIAPTRQGFVFDGWSTAALGGTVLSGQSYAPGVSAPITLYAQWTPNQIAASGESTSAPGVALGATLAATGVSWGTPLVLVGLSLAVGVVLLFGSSQLRRAPRHK